MVDFYCEYFGPIRQAPAGLDDDDGRAGLPDLRARHNDAGDGATATTGEILEVVAVRE